MNTEIHLCINTWMNKPPPQKTHCSFKQCQTETPQSDLHINVINQRAHSKLIDVCSVHNEEQQHCTAASASPECLLTAAALSGFPFLFHCGNWNCRCEAPCTGTSLVKREVLHDLFSEYLEYRLLFLTSWLLFWLKKKEGLLNLLLEHTHISFSHNPTFSPRCLQSQGQLVWWSVLTFQTSPNSCCSFLGRRIQMSCNASMINSWNQCLFVHFTKKNIKSFSVPVKLSETAVDLFF